MGIVLFMKEIRNITTLIYLEECHIYSDFATRKRNFRSRSQRKKDQLQKEDIHQQSIYMNTKKVTQSGNWIDGHLMWLSS